MKKMITDNHSARRNSKTLVGLDARIDIPNVQVLHLLKKMHKMTRCCVCHPVKGVIRGVRYENDIVIGVNTDWLTARAHQVM